MSRNRNVLTGWKYAGFIGAIVGAIGLATYPIIISPYLYPEKWQKMSREIRKEAGIKQEEIQPGNMKVKIESSCVVGELGVTIAVQVWSDPFDRPGKPGNK